MQRQRLLCHSIVGRHSNYSGIACSLSLGFAKKKLRIRWCGGSVGPSMSPSPTPSGQLSTRADVFFPTAHALGVASDVLVLSCALTEDTRHVVDRG
jgi:hypothetical protein